MRKLISARTAGNILLVIFGGLIVFHLLVMLGLLPSTAVWGGRAGSPASAAALETVSLLLTILFALVVAAKVGYIRAGRFSRLVNIFLWVIFAYLLLNTAGNLASTSTVEKLVFTPITLVAALLTLRLAIEK